MEQLYSLQSPPLALPSQTSGQHTILPLFQAASCSAAATTGSEDGLSNEDAQDAVLHVGGPVWAMAWCPSEVALPAAGPSNGAQHLAAKYLAVSIPQQLLVHSTLAKPLHLEAYECAVLYDYCSVLPSGLAFHIKACLVPLALLSVPSAPLACPWLLLVQVGCHPLHSQHNLLGKPLHGPALIQLWEVTNASQPPQQQQERQQRQANALPAPTLPRLALGIVHDGGLTWNCQWCPSPELTDEVTVGAAAAQGGRLPRWGAAACIGPIVSCLEHAATEQGRRLPAAGSLQHCLASASLRV